MPNAPSMADVLRGRLLMAKADLAPPPRMHVPSVPPVGAPASPEVWPGAYLIQEGIDEMKRPYVPLPPWWEEERPSPLFDPRG